MIYGLIDTIGERYSSLDRIKRPAREQRVPGWKTQEGTKMKCVQKELKRVVMLLLAVWMAFQGVLPYGDGWLSRSAVAEPAQTAINERDGSKIEGIDLFWITPDSELDNNGNAAPADALASNTKLFLATNSNALLEMKFQAEVSFSGQYDYAPGEIQITIPAQVWHTRKYDESKQGVTNPDGYVGGMDLSIPQAPSTSADFNWQIIDGNYVITNTKTIGATSKAMFQCTINNLKPSEIVDMSTCDPLTAHCEVVTNKGNVIQLTSKPIEAQIDTIAKVDYANKDGELFEKVPEKIPTYLLANLPGGRETAADYVYVRWFSNKSHTANQPFTLTFKDTLDCAYKVVGVDEEGKKILSSKEEDIVEGILLGSSNTSGTLSGNTYTTTVQTNKYTEASGSYDNTVVLWAAYPKDQFQVPTPREPQVEYLFLNDAEWKIVESDADAGSESAADGQKVTTATASGRVSYAPIQWKRPTGRFEVFKYTEEPTDKDYSYGYGLNKLLKGEDIDMNYVLRSVGFGYPWTSVRTNPDDPEFVGEEMPTLEDFGKLGWRQTIEDFQSFFNLDDTPLTPRDFSITYFQVMAPLEYSWRKAEYATKGYIPMGDALEAESVGYGDVASGQFAYLLDYNLPYPDMQIEYQVDNEDTWLPAATATWGETGRGAFDFVDVAAGITAEPSSRKVYFPENTTDVRFIFVSNVFGGKSAAQCNTAAIVWDVNVGIVLKASDEVIAIAEDLFEQGDLPSTKFRNDVQMEVDGWIKADANGKPLDGVRLEHGSNSFYDYSRATISGAGYGATLHKSVTYNPNSKDAGGDNDTENRRVILHYSALLEEVSNLTERSEYQMAVDEGVIVPETKGVWYDLLPEGVEPMLDTITLSNGETITSKYTVPNFRDTGRTLLVVEVDMTPDVEQVDHSEFWQDSSTIAFNAYIGWDAIDDLGTNAVNYIAFESKSDGLHNDTLGTIKDQQGEPDDPLGNMNRLTPNMPDDIVKALTGLDPDTTATDNRFLYAKADVNLNVNTSAVSGIAKTVKDDLSTSGWTQGLDGQEQVVVYEGHNYSYRLRVSSSENTTTKDMIIYDTIENYHVANDGTKDGDYAHTQDRLRWQGDWQNKGQWRGTLLSVDLADFINADAAPVLYYSTVEDLTFADSTEDMSQSEKLELFRKNEYDITNTTYWQKAELTADGQWVVPENLAGKVTAVAIDARKDVNGEDFILMPGEAISGYLRMVAPDDNSDPDTWHAKGAYAHKVDASGTPLPEVDWEAATDPKNNMYAFNNTRLKCIQGSTEAGGQSSDIMIRNDYTRVGILPGVIAVEKKWDDEENWDNLRPKSVSVTLMRKVAGAGGDYEAVPDATQTLSKDNGWKAYFLQVDLVDDQNNPYQFTFEEEPVPGYTTVVEQLSGNRYLITNTHQKETIDIKGVKEWDDNNNELGYRPAEIQLKLLRNGVLYRETAVTPDRDGNWAYSFGKQDKYAQGGIPYVYTLVETYVPKYKATSTDVTSMTNKLELTGSLSVEKQVRDLTDQVTDQEFTFTIQLYQERTAEEIASGAAPTPLLDNYPYTRYQLAADGTWAAAGAGTIATSSTFTLTGNEKIVIENLPSDSTYAITEEEKNAFILDDEENTTGRIHGGETAEAVFVNRYVTSGALQLKAMKNQTGHALRKSQNKFLLLDMNGDEPVVMRTAYSGMPTNQKDAETGVITGTAEAVFGQILFGNASHGQTYHFRVVEEDAGKPGYTYDENYYDVAVTVTDNGDGTMTIVAVDEATGDSVISADGSAMPFVNTYAASGEVTLKAWKVLNRRDLRAGEFTFELHRYDPATGDAVGKALATTTNDAEGNVVFAGIPALMFDQDDVNLNSDEPAVYHFVISEVRGDDATVEYSTAEFIYEIAVYDNGDGTLSFSEGMQTAERLYVDCGECDGTGAVGEVLNIVFDRQPYFVNNQVYSGFMSAGIYWNHDGYQTYPGYPNSGVKANISYACRVCGKTGTVEGADCPNCTNGEVVGQYCEVCVGSGYDGKAVCGNCSGCGYQPYSSYTLVNESNGQMATYFFQSMVMPEDLLLPDYSTNGEGNIIHKSFAAYGGERAVAVFASTNGYAPPFIMQANRVALDPGMQNYINEMLASYGNWPEVDSAYEFAEIVIGNHSLLTASQVCPDCDGTTKVSGDMAISGETTMPVFENDLKPGELTITKLVQGDGDPTQPFTFHVKLTGEGLPEQVTPESSFSEPEEEEESGNAGDSGTSVNKGPYLATSEELTGKAYAKLENGVLTFFRSDSETKPEDEDGVVYFDVDNALANAPYGGTGYSSWAWKNAPYAEQITSVVVQDPIKLISYSGFFSGLKNCTSMDLAKLDTSGSESLDYMFSGCSALVDVDVSGFASSRSLCDMNSMFLGCSSLKKIDLRNFVINYDWVSSIRPPTEYFPMNSMFSGCTSLEELNIANFDLSEVYSSDKEDMFAGKNQHGPCSSIKTITISQDASLPTAGFPDCLWVNLDNGYTYTTADMLSGNTPGTFVRKEPSYTLTFKPGDGAGSMKDQTVKVDEDYSFVSSFYRNGYRLSGFDVTINGASGTTTGERISVTDRKATIAAGTFADGDRVLLTAVWEECETSIPLINGEFTLTIYPNETVTIPGLPAGTQYQITEDPVLGWTLVEQQDDMGQIKANETSEAVFTNEYAAQKAKVALRASKLLDGAPAAAGAFSFELVGEDGSVIETVSNEAGGVIQFSAIEYTAVGEHTYTIREVAGTSDIIDYDDTTHTVKVVITKDETSGGLMASLTYDDAAAIPTFVNTTLPGGFRFGKEIAGSTAKASQQTFNFQISLLDEAMQPLSSETLAAVAYQINDGSWNAVSGSPVSLSLLGGDTVTFRNIPAGSRYEVKETGALAGWTMDDTVLTGTIAAATTSDLRVFTNTYTAKGSAVITGNKALTGRDLKANEFTFELTEAIYNQTTGSYSAGQVIDTATNGVDGSVSFAAIDYTGEGEFTYLFREVAGNDPTINYTSETLLVKVQVTDPEGKGVLTATVTYPDGDTLTNAVKTGKLTLSKQVISSNAAHQQQAFSFTLSLTDSEGQPLSGTYALSSGESLTVSGGEATLTVQAGGSITIEGLPHGATYAITEAAAGGFTATSTGETGTIVGDETAEAAFTNTYAARGEYVPTATKALEGMTLTANQFTFELRDAEGNTLQTATNDQDGKVTFAKLSFTDAQVGTHTYSIVEKNDGAAGMTYDRTEYPFTLTVTDNEDGTLTVSDDLGGAAPVFTNTYSEKTSLTVNKVWNDNENVLGIRPQSIDVELYRNGQFLMTAQVTAQDNWSYTFTDLPVFDDKGVDYLYQIKELPVEGYTSSSLVNGDTTTLTNTVLGGLEITKQVVNGNESQPFTFTLTLTNEGTPLTGSYAAVTPEGNVAIQLNEQGATTFQLKHGESFCLSGLPIGAIYKVEEEQTPGYTAQVTTGAADGTILRADRNTVTFTNTGDLTEFVVTKVWEGGGGPIELTLYANGVKMNPQPAYTRQDDVYTYQYLLKYDDLGNAIVYSAKETYFDGFVTIYDNVAPFEGVNDRIHNGGTIINREIKFADFKVKKVWEGFPDDIPTPGIQLVLYCNGEALDVPTPPRSSGGWYKYYDLPDHYKGVPATYYVLEVPVPGFTTSYQLANGEAANYADNGGRIINVKLPVTGDKSMVELWTVLAGASALVMAGLLVLTKRKQSKKAK